MPDIEDISTVLPEDDVRLLRERYRSHVVRQVGSELHVLIRDFPFPEAYSPRSADLLLRLPPGYPDAAPDMFWTRPDVKLANGGVPQNCEHHEVPGAGAGVEVYENIPWQRWSRHFQGGWQVGRHGLHFFVGSIIQELKQGI
jgi:hypothetical protein